MVVHAFNSRTTKAEADRSLSLMPTLSTEQVSGQSSKGSEEQKVGGDIIEWGGSHVPVPVSSKTWQNRL